MNLFQRISGWLGAPQRGATGPEVGQLRAAIDRGRQHKRQEAHDEALADFDEAARLASSLSDRAALALIDLHRADVLIEQRRYDEAGSLLSRMFAEAESRRDAVQQSYILSAQGTLEQSRGDWDAANSFYERARKVAAQAGAMGAEGRAMGHMADVYLHEGNASYAVHLLRETLPRLNSSGDIELSSYFVGRLGQALVETGQTAEGQQLLGRALRLAQHMKSRPFERLWQHVLGDHAFREARYTDAYNHYERALETLPEQAPERVEVLQQISRACLNLGKDVDALAYARSALRLDPDGAETQGVLGVVLRTIGHSADALPYLRYALDHTDGDEPTEIIRNLAAALADTGSSEEAHTAFARALQLARIREDHLEAGRAHRDHGLLYVREGRMAEAIRAFTAALEIYEQQSYHAQVARLHCDIARLRIYLGQNQRAMKDYEQALMALGSVDDPETRGVVISNAAIAYVDQGDLETAESFFAEAIKIAQRQHDRRVEATRQGNYGWFLLATGRVRRALGALEQALKQSQALDLTLNIAVQTSNLAQAHAENGDHVTALSLQRRALETAVKSGDRHWIALIQVNLAQQLLRGMKKAAVDDTETLTAEIEGLLRDALAAGRQIESSEVQIRALTVQAACALARGDIDGAGVPAQEAVALARRTHTQRLLAEALLVCAEWRARSGNLQLAGELWAEARRLFDLLHHPAAQSRPDWLNEVV